MFRLGGGRTLGDTGGADRLWSGDAYDTWFDQRWGRYAFAVETAAVTAALGPFSGQRVLDVGCGTGRLAHLLATRGAHVVGLDLDPSMLEVAATRIPGQVVRGDARCLPVRTASMDAVVVVAVLEFVADPGPVVEELRRVTRSGGRIIIGALNPQSPWGVLHRRELHRAPWSAARFLTRHDLLDLARHCGPATLESVLFAPGPLPGWRGSVPPSKPSVGSRPAGERSGCFASKGASHAGELRVLALPVESARWNHPARPPWGLSPSRTSTSRPDR